MTTNKRAIKSLLLTVGAVMFLFSSVVYTSCKKTAEVVDQECVGVECRNNGVCIDGNCSCTSGYTGKYCEEKNNARYIGKWNVTQQVISSNNQAAIGKVTNYQMQISEDASGVTVIRMDGLNGSSSYSVTARIGMKIGFTETSAGTVEIDVLASPSNFVFKRYQTFAGTSVQLVKGEGFVNEIGTQLSGTFETVMPDSVKGAIEETISFSAGYID